MKSELECARIQGKIDVLNTAIDRLYDKAKAEKRVLTYEEKQVAHGLEAEVKNFEAEITEQPLTVQNSRHNFRGGSGPFNSFGDFLQATAQSARPGAQIDRRLYAATGLGESVPSEGGFLVSQDFTNDLVKSVFETGKLAALCRRIPISANANSIKINAFDETSRAATRFGGILGYWKDEAALKTASKPTFRQMELTLHKLIGLIYSSDELLQDATALEAIIRQAFASEFGFMLDDAIINGTGAGMPLGVMQSGCLVSVAKETGQKADTVVAENIMKMWSRLINGSEASAVWLCNKNVLPQLMTMSLSVGTGGIPVYMPANAIAGVPYQTLMGRPVIFCEQCPTLGDAGDIILADFQNGYVLAEKGGIQADKSIHVLFQYDESCFRFVLRIDGQPVLAAPITPYKGGATSAMSFFVTLAERA